MILNVGPRQYELVEGWGQLPAGWQWGQVGSVCVDSEDNVHAFTRTNHPYMIFDKSGKMIDHWGEGIFEDPHGMCITPDDTVYFVDRTPQTVMKFDKAGRHRLTLGTRGEHSDTGYGEETRIAGDPLLSGGGMPDRNGVGHSGPPFHHPTDVTVAPSGEIYVSDGYRNASVHKFAANGSLIKSWGATGSAADLRDTKDGPGQFHTVHGIWEHKGKVYVSDRENNRIQIFTPDGQFLDMWAGFGRPTKIYIAPDDVMYVSELEDRFSLVNLDGTFIGHGGNRNERSHEPGKFWGPHGIWADSAGDIYVSEVLEGQRVQKFARIK